MDSSDEFAYQFKFWTYAELSRTISAYCNIVETINDVDIIRKEACLVSKSKEKVKEMLNSFMKFISSIKEKKHFYYIPDNITLISKAPIRMKPYFIEEPTYQKLINKL